MDYTQEVLDTLFNEKVNEFIQYQQHVCKRINNLCSELFPQKVVDIIDEYENTKHLLFTTEERAEIIDGYQPDIDEIKERIADLNEELENI